MRMRMLVVRQMLSIAWWCARLSEQAQSTAGCPPGCLCPAQTDHISCENAGLVEVPRSGISPTVTSLDLSDNQLTMLTSGSLVALRNVVRLKLDNNEIERILDGAFEQAPSLQNLHLSGNNLTVIQSHAFRGAEMLLHLDLSDNLLTTVDGAFADLRQLSRLDLRNNRLTEITQFTFRDQLNLRYLLLSENHIVHVDRRAFRSLEKLMYLVLRGNPIGSVHRFQFQFHSLFLSYVDLSECNLAVVPRGLPASIRYLQLRRNNMTSVRRTSFRDCPFVSILVLDENSISEIEDGAFQNMPYLQQLWLNHNRLTKLPSGLPASVLRLLIESNSIRTVTEDAFPVNGSQMVAMSLAGNHISTLRRGDLRRLGLLRALDVSVNNIRRLHADAFADNTRLRSLQLSRNPLAHLSTGCFRGLAVLRRLSLAFVPTVDVHVAPGVFGDLPTLTALDLDSSPALARALMDSDSLLSSLSAVQELGLLNTQLVRLRPDLPRYLPSLVVIRLSSTRWHCDAAAAVWMRAWMASTGVEVVGVGEIRCLTPPELRGRSLLTLPDWELDGSRPTAPIVFRPLRDSTTAGPRLRQHQKTGHFGSLLNWPPRRPVGFDEYADTMDIDFHSDLYDEDGNDDADDVHNSHYEAVKDLEENPGVLDVYGFGTPTPEVIRSSSTLPTTRRTKVTTMSAHGRLRHPSTAVSTATTTPRLQQFSATAELEVERPAASGGGQSHVELLVTLTILATAIVVVVVIVAIVLLTRRTGRQSKKRNTSVELRPKLISNGVKQNGGTHNGPGGHSRPRRPQNSLRGRLAGEGPGLRLPVVAFSDQAGSDHVTAGALDISSCSVEALSLIPGRDINHEGPHRVYQWADF